MDLGVEKRSGDDELTRIAETFADLATGPQLHLIDRYEARLHRMYSRSLHNFLHMREIKNNQTNLRTDNPQSFQQLTAVYPSVPPTP